MIYHFLVESKPHERIDVLITASENIYQTKKEKKSIPTVMKTCFFEGKLMKQFGNPLSERLPLSTNPYISEQFFMTPLFVQILKKRTPLLLILGGRKL